MGAMLASLAALLMVVVFIVVGIRISTYLFVQHAVVTPHLARGMRLAGQRLRSDTLHTGQRPRRHRVLDTSHANSRLALHTLMVITLIFILTIIATISILFGSVH
jgi:hypothetical protein